jgi:lipopolysaccharide export system permease protein
MKTIQRLYLKDFIKLLFVLAAGLSIIFSLLDLISRIDDFMPGRPSTADLGLYALLTMPKFSLYLLPMSVLICSLFTFSQAFHRKEITAIKTAGGRLRTLFRPFIAAGIVLSLLAFITGEIVVPHFSKKAAELKNSFEGRGKMLAFSDGGLWLKSKDGSPIKIDLYVIEKKIAKGISIFITDKDFLKERIMAEKASWNGAMWVLSDVVKYDIRTGRMDKFKTMDYPDLESPDFFSEEIKTTDEMGISELYRYMQRLKNAGFRNMKLAVDINSKISFPLINVFMMLLGISLSVRVGFGGALFSAGLGLLISLIYWFSYTFSLSLGYAGMLPPFLSAWLIPFVFGILALHLFANIPE